MAAVLLVEDHELFRELTARMLVDLGHEVVVAGTPAEALAIASDSERALGLVVSDVDLPEGGGPALVRRLLDLRADLKAILTSGFDLSGLHESCADPDRCAFLEKPFRARDLAAAIARLLGT